MKKLVAKKEAVVVGHVITAACGHERHFDVKLSQMAEMYIKQHPCDNCELKEIRA